MKRLNKPRLLLCLAISTVLNVYWYLDNRNDQERFSRLGIITPAYIKDITKESSNALKFKYTRVASLFFITQKGDSIRQITKNTWAMNVKELQTISYYLPLDSFILQTIPYYLPLDSVIYNKNDPNDFELISEYRNYSNTFNIIAYFFVGLPFSAAWGYGLFFILNKMYMRRKNRNFGPVSL